MDFKELHYSLALQNTKGIGSIKAKKLIEAYGSATNLFEAHQNKAIKKNINAKEFASLFSEESLAKAERELEVAKRANLAMFTMLDAEYPSYLKNCIDAPTVLFKDGAAKNSINDFRKIISIVGTRNITAYGRDFCKDLIASLKEYNPLIVSGYAFGVDICAHTEALKQGLDTVAVLAHGFGTVYPKEHKKYYAALKESSGFLTEFNFKEPPYRENFLKRNRIVAGMSQATIIIESAQKGGSLVTADLANSYNKDVFAVPGRVHDTYSKGCNNLIKNHKAALITSGEDLVQQLGWAKHTKSITPLIQPQLFVNLEGDQKIIYDLLAEKQMYVDELSRLSKIPIYKISNGIFQLEMQGLIQVLPGKLIKRN